MSLCDPRSPKVLLPSSLINLFLCRRIHRFLSACETLDSVNPFIGTYFTLHGLICLQAVHRLCGFVNDTFVCPREYRVLNLFSSITAHMLHQSAQENKITKNVNCRSCGSVARLCTECLWHLTPTKPLGWLGPLWVEFVCVFPCLLGFSLGASAFPPQSKDMYVWLVCWLYSRWWCESVCVCLSVLALWWLGTTVYPVFCLLTDGIDCRHPMT